MPRERVWAEIDLDAIRSNLATVQSLVGSAVDVMAVLKADAYGHGAVAVARALADAGVTMIGVGDSSEAIELRQAGIRCPILILGAIVDGEVEAVVRYGISTCIHSHDRLRLLAGEARRQQRVAPVQLMVDTGMGRLGISPGAAPELLLAIQADPAVALRGLATHFSSPGDAQFTCGQLDQFRALIQRVEAAGKPIGQCHAAASAALLRYPQSRLDMVRPGILLYGTQPSNEDVRGPGFLPALTLRTQVIFLKQVPAGSPLSYRGTHVTSSPTRIATLPVGYDDGLPLSLSNRTEVLIGGQRAPLVGAVSMDYCLVDVGHLPQVQLGDVVTLIGRDGADEISLEQVARRAKMIPYAITCGLGRRVRRLYQGVQPGSADRAFQAPPRFDFLKGVC